MATLPDFRPDASAVMGAEPMFVQPVHQTQLPMDTLNALTALLKGITPLNAPASHPDMLFVTADPATQTILNKARAIRDRAPVAYPILITGPSGSGKELLARLAARVGAAFVALNMAAIPETLVASQLFGHVKGAFTGAADNYKGAFVSAGDGTIFLDEIGDMPEAQQPVLLRVIERRIVTAVGSIAEQPIHCRIIAATNRPESLREDLRARFMYELNLPGILSRGDDKFLIGEHYGLTRDEVLAIPTTALERNNARAIRQAAAWKELGI